MIAVQNPLVSERWSLCPIQRIVLRTHDHQQKIKGGAWARGQEEPLVGAGAWPLDTCAGWALASEGVDCCRASGHWFCWQSLSGDFDSDPDAAGGQL